MVKGISKRAVVVRPQGSQTFEQAIFIVTENASRAMSQEEMLREATKIATTYAPKNKSIKYKMRPSLIFVAGAASTALLWVVSLLIW